MPAYPQNRQYQQGRPHGQVPQNTDNRDPIPSPYNFVPLADKVYFPDGEKDLVSMDKPFSDGICGTLNIKVTAKTPIYIRNGGAHPEKQEEKQQNANYKDFYRVHPNGPYAIPGTSLKGMLRNVVEIASFGKIIGGVKSSKVNNHRYAVRDLSNPALYNNHITETTQSGAFKPKVHAAWLDASEDKWKLTFCHYARVEQVDLERIFHCSLGKRGTIENKYQNIHPYTKIYFDAGPETDHQHSQGKRLNYKLATNLQPQPLAGKTCGEIVLTGQPMNRQENGHNVPGRKHMEFIFYNQANDPVDINDELKMDFTFAHSELGENRKPNKEWKYWSEKVRKKRIPVFLLLDDDHKPLAMGLAMMFRLPYKHSIHQTIDHTSLEHSHSKKLDLAELLFGRVEDKDALRGRVTVETLLADGNPQTGATEVVTVLSGPKPTYYPNYVQQPEAKEGQLAQGRTYKTYMDFDAKIRGWKRYIVRADNHKPEPDVAPTQSVETRFKPLPAGTSFSGIVHVHNLRPFELGALCWAITWGGDTALRHSLGMAKPYGFGSVVIEITGSHLYYSNPQKVNKPEWNETLAEYVSRMSEFLPGWQNSAQIHALKTIANPNTQWPQEIRYPKLGQGKGNNEFQEHKKVNHVLVNPPKLPAVDNTQTKNKPIETKQTQQPVVKQVTPAKPVIKEQLVVDCERANASSFNHLARKVLSEKKSELQKESAIALIKQGEKLESIFKKAKNSPEHDLNKLKQLVENLNP